VGECECECEYECEREDGGGGGGGGGGGWVSTCSSLAKEQAAARQAKDFGTGAEGFLEAADY
jgi:hypothetical protein